MRIHMNTNISKVHEQLLDETLGLMRDVIEGITSTHRAP